MTSWWSLLDRSLNAWVAAPTVSASRRGQPFVNSSQLDLAEWIDFGLSVAVDGDRCSIDAVLEDGVEVALLPPVSGG